jgi:hypothetical protein
MEFNRVNIGRIKKVHLEWVVETIKGVIRKIQMPGKKVLISSFLIISMLGIGLRFFVYVHAQVEYSKIETSTNYTEYISLADVERNGSVLGDNFLPAKSHVSQFKGLDKRVYVLDEYFKSRQSPLYGYAKEFVEACDRFGAPKDCISTVAIARHETDLCNYYNSADYFNCMGWGGGGEHRRRFSSFAEHINIATDVLVNQYGPEYMDDPRLMENVFCGPQAECDGWGQRVLFFMREIDNFAVSLGVGRLTDLRDDGLRY